MPEKEGMGKKSRNKGSRGELEVIKIIKRFFPEWAFRRTPLSGGWGNEGEFKTHGDIITDYPHWDYTVEVKFSESFTFLDALLFRGNVRKWYAQAVDEANANEQAPLLAFRKAHRPWFVLTPYQTFLKTAGFSAMIIMPVEAFEMAGGQTYLVFTDLENFMKRYSHAKGFGFEASGKLGV